MKKILLIIAIIAATSCGKMGRTDYEYTMHYDIGGLEYVHKGVIEAPDGYVPTYMASADEIIVMTTGTGGRYGRQNFSFDLVYSGKEHCSVVKFDYKPVRTYKVSKFNGKEVK